MASAKMRARQPPPLVAQLETRLRSFPLRRRLCVLRPHGAINDTPLKRGGVRRPASRPRRRGFPPRLRAEGAFPLSPLRPSGSAPPSLRLPLRCPGAVCALAVWVGGRGRSVVGRSAFRSPRLRLRLNRGSLLGRLCRPASLPPKVARRAPRPHGSIEHHLSQNSTLSTYLSQVFQSAFSLQNAKVSQPSETKS